MTRAGAVLVGACLIAGCDPLTAPHFARDGFVVEAARGEMVLDNRSDAAVHHVLVEESGSALLDLHPDPEATWPAVAAGAVKRVPYPEIIGYTEEATEVRVYWWTRGEHRDHFVIELR